MAQLSLFDSGAQMLLDDTSGCIVLIPDLVDRVTAQIWFDQLHGGSAWKAGRRLMYEREVDVPRLRAHFRSDDPDLPGTLYEAQAVVANAANTAFDSIGLNLYHDQYDSVAPQRKNRTAHTAQCDPK
ncbi:MAG TPA: hypothetical protein VGV14_11570 [Rhodanobacter sp.]|nr:hypothetical protein [Rhodanobacter sp.]